MMSRPGSNDTEFQASADTPMSEKEPSSDDVIIVNDEEENVNATEENNVVGEENDDKEDAHYTKRKRKLTSPVWEHFRKLTAADGTKLLQCMHCNEKLKVPKDSSTTPLNRHVNNYCPKLKAGVKGAKGQLKLNVSSASGSSSMVQNWKFSNNRMRELVSHMIMVHELPFNFVEYELFNVLMKEANPEFEKISRAAARQDCVSSYELGKKRIQKLLNNVKRVSITTDMWTSLQNIHYMVVTCHFVDSDFDLHKYILSFVDVPPPYTGVNIYDCLYKCLKDWNIETKVATLTVGNAKTNDVVARMLLENLNVQKKLPLDWQLFHVRCCAHILNLLVQDGLSKIQHIVHKVRESVKHVGASPGRLHLFTQLTKQLQLKNKHLILDVTTRWNATYAMLSTALEFKKVFVNYADRESSYKTLPSSDDWDKVDSVCSFLSLFNEATKIISGFEYPTSNLFLSELYVIKEALDKVALNKDDCMNSMALKMKEKFDKYWGSSNLLISFGTILDPRYKMELIKFSFKIIYSEGLWEVEAQVVLNALEDLFEEYVEAHKESNDVQSNSGTGIRASTSNKSSFPTSRFSMNTGSAKFAQHIRSVNTVERVKSELATYLDEGVHLCETDTNFDALKWWKENRHRYRILSKMAADILSVPITTVASESAFSAGGRVIDPHRSCLGTKMVDMLICGVDWYRHYYGLHKKKSKENGDISYIMLE